jgi:hypothetical protein
MLAFCVRKRDSSGEILPAQTKGRGLSIKTCTYMVLKVFELSWKENKEYRTYGDTSA